MQAAGAAYQGNYGVQQQYQQVPQGSSFNSATIIRPGRAPATTVRIILAARLLPQVNRHLSSLTIVRAVIPSLPLGKRRFTFGSISQLI